MARDEAYYEAEKKIEECWRIRKKTLNLSGMGLTELPASIGKCTSLEELALSYNQLTELPESLGLLIRLKVLRLDNNRFKALPESLGNLTELNKVWIEMPLGIFPDYIRRWKKLTALFLSNCELDSIPAWLAELTALVTVLLKNNHLTDIPCSLAQLEHLRVLELSENPLNPELAEAYRQGFDAVKAYLRAKAAARKLKVFLCYASQDKRIVHTLYQRLITEEWLEPWLDAKKLLPGQDWQAEIKNAVATADNVIIFLSGTSINKDGFIQKELRFAKDVALEKSEGSVFLIPLRLDDCQVPRSLQIYQWADYFGEEQERTYHRLLESLIHRLEDIKRREVHAS